MILIEILIGLLFAFLLRKGVEDFQNESDETQVKNEPVKIVVEIINDTYYAWILENNEFVLQSSNKEIFVEELKKKFPNQNLNLLSKEKIEW